MRRGGKGDDSNQCTPLMYHRASTIRVSAFISRSSIVVKAPPESNGTTRGMEDPHQDRRGACGSCGAGCQSIAAGIRETCRAGFREVESSRNDRNSSSHCFEAVETLAGGSRHVGVRRTAVGSCFIESLGSAWGRLSFHQSALVVHPPVKRESPHRERVTAASISTTRATQAEQYRP